MVPSFKLNFTVILGNAEVWLVSCHHMWHASCRACVTSQRFALETVAMEMLSGTGVGLDEDGRCEHEERQHIRGVQVMCT